MQNPYAANQEPELSLAQSPVLGSETSNAPTFAAPSVEVPPLRPYDLQAPGIDHVPELQVDPYVGDLLAFDRPRGLSLMAASENPLLTDPVTPDLSAYGRPDGLIMPSLELVDPSLPDLQSPQLTQDVHMPDRPGEMGMGLDNNDDDGENDGLALSLDGDNDDDDGPMPPYDQSHMTPGLSHRQRRMDALYRGLKGDL
jgi:hypothetical protein